MLTFLRHRWFLLALASLIALGHLLGLWTPQFVSAAIEPIFSPDVRSGLIVTVLFLMSATLDSRRVGQAILSPGPVLWAIAVNVLAMPLAAPLLMPLQSTADFALGMLIVASVPSTLAAASVWTRRAGGNDAVSLLVTVITNGACFLYTPFWLQTFGSTQVQLDVRDLMLRLFLTALLPTIAGQLARWPARSAALADRLKTPLGVAAQVGVLIIVFASACDAGLRLGGGHPATSTPIPAPTLASVAILLASCVALHLVAFGLALCGARLAGFASADVIGVAFAASQKTLPIGVLIATDPRTFGSEFPWAVYPMLIYHAAQLFIDTALADRFRGRPALGNPAAPGLTPPA